MEYKGKDMVPVEEAIEHVFSILLLTNMVDGNAELNKYCIRTWYFN